ncbi:hypothetical protein CBR_g41812 [Chara braunii]|uniref:Uncharacterized protein n=1 Tax=Chara braunii TaxID=69332 RepID=A0A388LWP6_CHABU|nr:hypothetical protein CBR_g41812 [Chara braunii]|eukprot:GBG86748.1 hypothetical protein CBR_g41812 [Chara braunii]
MNIVGVIENVAVKVGRVHVLVNSLVIDAHSYSVLLGLPWAMASMDFDIRHWKHERHGNADGLTRLHRPEKVPKSEEVIPWNEAKDENGPWYGQVEILSKEVKVTWTRTDEHQGWIEYLELLIIQAWRTDVEGDLLGFLFGSVRPGHRQLIAQELVVPLAQLVDDLSLDIVSQSDENPAPHVLTRTLAPYLQWTACLEEPGSESALPSQQEYLKPYGIINLAFYPKQDTSEEAVEGEGQEEATEEEGDAEEETSEEGSHSEHSEGEQSVKEEEEEDDQEKEAGSEWEALSEEAARTGTKVEDPEAARKREKIAAGKRQLEFASAANLRINDDLTRDPEPPKPEDGNPAAMTPSASRRRRSRSPSPSTSARPPVRPHIDAGDRPSSPVIIPPSP